MFEEAPLEDWEYPEPDMEEDEEFSETKECPACGAEIYEDAECCPICGEYIEFSTHALAGWPIGFVLLGLLGVVAVVLTLLL